MSFKPVSSQVDFPSLERELLDFWYKEGIVEKYLKKNKDSNQKFSFLDGPITANNPMGVHHGWGRTYKDLWQRFFNMKGFQQRFQNGFDEQGLWVEVEVEKELGLKSKKDIENLVTEDKFKSLEKFINLCKERVKKFSQVQTGQSKRLGYFMDWDNSYHTSSDDNNYAIWNYIKIVNGKGWLYKDRDSVPWCPRCGTAISQHEILTEEYKEIEHESVYFKLPVKNKKNEFLVVWTTTPWTIPANVAVAVDTDLGYVEVEKDGQNYIVAKDAAQRIFRDVGEIRVVREYKGKDLVGWEYLGPFDNLEAVKDSLMGYTHRVIATDPLILPVSAEDGTGLVHIATGAGTEDFQLGKKEKLPVIAPIDEAAIFVEGFEGFEGLGVKEAMPKIIHQLKDSNFLYKAEQYKHRYPNCWRCKTELVWRVVDEWYIAMDRPSQNASDGKQTYREQMIEVAKKINWMPKWGLERELDWLKNMHDWLISKKRYWGLALPIWECQCGNFEVIGGIEQLREKAIDGWKEFEGHSPHRPWVDQVKIKCSKCAEIISRIPDVGNPWLDAGIVPFSTMPINWFPADFITEGFPGQFKNWFYSLIAMSTALKNTNPFKNLLGFANLLDEKGEEMHKSKGNAIEFNEAADKIGVDVMRWLYITQNPEYNLLFGYHVTDEIRRRFYLIFWNTYKFFIDYALLANWECDKKLGDLTILDKWILVKLTNLVLLVNKKLANFDGAASSRAIEEFIVNDFSTWYIRRSRNRVGPEAKEQERNTTLSVMYGVLVTVCKITAPFMPFITEEIFKNLTNETSVHLQPFPLGDKKLLDEQLVSDMALVRKIAEAGHAKRKEVSIRLRQPLSLLIYSGKKLSKNLEQILAEELNVKKVEYKEKADLSLDTKITKELAKEGEARDLIRQIQELRKEKNLTLKDRTKILAPSWPKDFENQILNSTASVSITSADKLEVKIDEPSQNS